MTDLVERVTESGLVLYEHREDGAAVARALQALDSRLSLRVDQTGLWRVYFNDQGRDVFLLAWADAEGRPLPLSMRLVEEIQKQDRGGRGEPLTAEVMNERLEQQMERARQNTIEAIRDDHLPAIRSKRHSVRIKEKPWQTQT